LLSVCLCLSFSLCILPNFWGIWDHFAVCVFVQPPLIFVRRLTRWPCFLCVPQFFPFPVRSVSYQGGLWDHLAAWVSVGFSGKLLLVLTSRVIPPFESRGSHYHIVACRAVAEQQPQDKQIYSGRCWLTASQRNMFAW
jgi:hypothetical protein